MKHTLLFFLFSCSCLNSSAQNLLQNASAEHELINGVIPNWTPTIGGNWLISEYTVYPQVETETAGTQFFYPGYNYANVNNELTSELSQTIDLFDDADAIDAGTQAYFFNGYTISFDQTPADQSNLFIDFLSADDALLSTTHFGPFSATQDWIHLTEAIIPPANTRKAVVRMRSILINGSSCDGLYEDLYFGRTPLLNVRNISVNPGKIYPNPTTGIVHLANLTEPIALFDFSGRPLARFEAGTTVIDLSRFSVGIYLLNSGKSVYKIVRK